MIINNWTVLLFLFCGRGFSQPFALGQFFLVLLLNVHFRFLLKKSYIKGSHPHETYNNPRIFVRQYRLQGIFIKQAQQKSQLLLISAGGWGQYFSHACEYYQVFVV